MRRGEVLTVMVSRYETLIGRPASPNELRVITDGALQVLELNHQDPPRPDRDRGTSPNRKGSFVTTNTITVDGAHGLDDANQQPQGAVVSAFDFQTAVKAVDAFASDVEAAFEREYDDVDWVQIGFYGTHIVVDGGDAASWGSAHVKCEGDPFEHDEIMVTRDDLRTVARFVGAAAGDVVTSVAILPSRDGYLSFRVGDFDATVPFEWAEEPYVPRRRAPLMVAAGIVAGVLAYGAIRAITSYRSSK